MSDPGSLLVLAVTLLVMASSLYWLLANVYLASWLADAPQVPDPKISTPPVTFLRPIKRDTPRLAENLASLLQSMRADDQLVLGVDASSDTAAACETIRAQFPGHDIVIVACSPGAAVNPKISKLVQMTPRARHEHWILSDSEAVLDAEFLASFRHEWAASKADTLTAAYRFANLDTWPQRLDAAAALLTLWPGLAMVRRFGRVRLTLGACTGFRRSDLDAIGGFTAVGDELAEDNRLGVLLGNAGRTIRLSAHVITLVSDALSWRDYWRHQRRVAVTYRISNPAGFAASIVTHGLPLSLLAVLAPHPFASRIAAIAFLAAWTMRWLAALHTSRTLNFPIPRLALVVLLASFVETACWIACWLSPRVWWSSRWWRISRNGKLTPLEHSI
jgi:ceramide glucosyltransferase